MSGVKGERRDNPGHSDWGIYMWTIVRNWMHWATGSHECNCFYVSLIKYNEIQDYHLQLSVPKLAHLVCSSTETLPFYGKNKNFLKLKLNSIKSFSHLGSASQVFQSSLQKSSKKKDHTNKLKNPVAFTFGSWWSKNCGFGFLVE